ncbi:hypothetical protein PG987_013924 [Apiospora arundinis]
MHIPRGQQFPNSIADSHCSVNQSPATRDRATAKQHDRATKPKSSISSPAERQRCQCREDVDGDTEDEYDTGLRVYCSSSHWVRGSCLHHNRKAPKLPDREWSGSPPAPSPALRRTLRRPL